MKKTLKIGDSDVTFECNAVTPAYYKQEFRRDFFGDIIKLSKAMPTENLEEIDYEDIEHLDLDVLGRFAFACFKTANKETQLNYMGFLTLYPEFSFMEHGMEISEIIIEGIQPKKK